MFKLAPWIAGDSPSYLDLAANIERGFYGAILEGQIQPDTLRPPGYPLILWFLIHQLHLSAATVIALQMCAYLGSIRLIERFLARSGLPANVFLLIAAAYPFGAIYSAGFMTESWVMLGYTALALLLARQHIDLATAILCGLIAGALGLLRTDLLPMFLIGAAILAWRSYRSSERRRDLMNAGALVAAAIVVLTPYAVWNQTNFRTPSPAPMAAATGNSLYSAYWQEKLSNEVLTAFYSGKITPPLVSSGYLAEIGRLNRSFGAPPLISPANPLNYPTNALRIQTNIVFGKAAIAHFRSEPALYAKHMLKNVWFLWNTSEYHDLPFLMAAGLTLASAWVCILGVGGAVSAMFGGWTLLPRSISIFVLFPYFAHIPLHLEARYTAAARPLLMMFAAATLIGIFRRYWGASEDHAVK